MEQLTINQLDDVVLARLNSVAKATGRSAEDVARDILTREALIYERLSQGPRLSPAERGTLVASIRDESRRPPSEDSTDMIRRERDSR